MSLGMGIIITYSSYIKKQENPVVTGFATGVSDFLFAIIASFAIIPAVFSAGIEPGAGPGLIFETLPFIFTSLSETMPVLSSIIAILFFLTILIAALTSSVSLMEVGVAYFVDEKKMKRSSASLLVFAVVWAAGAVCSLSFGPLKGVTLFGNNIFDIFDKFASNFLLLIGGMLTLVFVGWKMDKASVRDEFTSSGKARGSRRLFESTYFLIKYVAPVLLGIVFIANFL
jgi:NSS family neurotransmitter:Na+ symporter